MYTGSIQEKPPCLARLFRKVFFFCFFSKNEKQLINLTLKTNFTVIAHHKQKKKTTFKMFYQMNPTCFASYHYLFFVALFFAYTLKTLLNMDV